MRLNRRRFLTAGAAGVTALAMPSVLLAQTTPYKIYMILYRGETEVEKGFREYLSSRRLPVELIIRDVDRDIRK
ncbi:MAG TPA: twin-arginine translocation signal domain-containing protein, partial [Noviherbaspirillum sp.]|uniref:twin-arginine translocation signal domain-containing protein n=1 Tax=Noviherbaspirillum sp. TaxID=1926288 RepID=UPI002DDC9A33